VQTANILHECVSQLGEPRKETVSQGGGACVSLSGGDERSEPESAILNLCPATSFDAQGAGRAADAHGGAVGTAAALPCLNTINCNEGKNDCLNQLSAGQRKTAFALKLNVLWLIEKHGLERIGFLTLTFARHIVAYKEAQKALHSLMTGVLKNHYPEYIIVMERMDSKRIHYHLLVVMAEDIRTRFDFAAVKRGDYRSAGDYLRKEWKFWRDTAPRYGFGRTELLPIKKTAEGVAKYVGKYVAKHIGQRLPEDKGARLVRYSKGANPVGTRLSWVSPGAMMWRAKLGTFCRSLNLNSDNYQEFLKEWFGRNWVYHLRPLILAIKLPEFYTEEESRTTLRAVWTVAVIERERRCNHKRRDAVAARKQLMPDCVDSSPAKPVCTWASWIERTIKDD
jgi:hypothetical protein